MRTRSLAVALAVFCVAGCALTVSYEDYERSSATGNGGSTGIGGAISDSGTDALGGSSGSVACTNDEPCGLDTACQDHYCDGAFCQVMNLTNDDCAPATCTGTTESTPAHCENGSCVESLPVDCLPFKCEGGVCLTDCNGNDDCAPGTICDNGGCTPCTTCSAKLIDPTLMLPLCQPESETLASSLAACCVGYCQDFCGGATPFLVCGGDAQQIDSICLGCLSDANYCKAPLINCQIDQ